MQCIKYFKSVFLEIQNARRWSVFSKMVTYDCDDTHMMDIIAIALVNDTFPSLLSLNSIVLF